MPDQFEFGYANEEARKNIPRHAVEASDVRMVRYSGAVGLKVGRKDDKEKDMPFAVGLTFTRQPRNGVPDPEQTVLLIVPVCDLEEIARSVASIKKKLAACGAELTSDEEPPRGPRPGEGPCRN